MLFEIHNYVYILYLPCAYGSNYVIYFKRIYAIMCSQGIMMKNIKAPPPATEVAGFRRMDSYELGTLGYEVKHAGKKIYAKA